MGGAVSAQSKPSENVLLRKFAGLEPITDNDPFWNQLLSFNMKIDQNDRNALKDFELSINDPLEALMYNTQTTGNFAAFIRVFLRRSAELKMSALCNDKIFLWQTGNALMILRFICKFLTQRLSDSEFAKVFTKNILTPDGKMEACPDFEEPFENTAEELLNALVEILVDLAVNESTMPVHIEAVKCLLSVLSSQLYHETAQGASQFYGYLMSGRW
uniref:Dymeclin n=1 Tax=Plectus sambesii TaxID=2011161 RepID=A0A914W7Y3_9BILA